MIVVLTTYYLLDSSVPKHLELVYLDQAIYIYDEGAIMATLYDSPVSRLWVGA